MKVRLILTLGAAVILAACQSAPPRSAEVSNERRYRSAVLAKSDRAARGHALALARSWALGRDDKPSVIAVHVTGGRRAYGFAAISNDNEPILID